MPFAAAMPRELRRYHNIHVKIEDDITTTSTTTELTSSSSSFLNFYEKYYFRLLTCLFMSTLLDANLACCQCYPKNVTEMMCWRAGIKLNCISKECESWLSQHPTHYDPLFVGDCREVNQVAIANIRAFALERITIDVHIQQLLTEALGEEPSSTNVRQKLEQLAKN
jgi:hypothetical protein